MARATSFLQFCYNPRATAMRVTWSELDQFSEDIKLAVAEIAAITLPELPDTVFKDILKGRVDIQSLKEFFPTSFHNFLEECYTLLRLQQVSEADVEKFMKGKPELTKEDIIKLLPEWLSDLHTGFLQRLADELPPQHLGPYY
jgi:hypothetical protein